ncbi:MAG: ORF6N domain-containing protein [Bacteroidales bacterium]|nr:ORF6N domain-containing protein [Bacteroidota bacterium]MBL6949126.1 ORF6N domain-containing protein [Bacteroidales bacterium]
MKKDDLQLVPEEVILSKIYLIRKTKVMLDTDLGVLYGVETKQLKRAVRRQEKRFPPDFMFELTRTEFENLRRQFGTSSWGGARYSPMAFTEQGVAMLSSVLNSERAIHVNIQIIRIFTRMREMPLANKDIVEKLKHIEQKLANHNDKILLVFEYLKQREQAKQDEVEFDEREQIGFKRSNETKEV